MRKIGKSMTGFRGWGWAADRKRSPQDHPFTTEPMGSLLFWRAHTFFSHFIARIPSSHSTLAQRRRGNSRTLVVAAAPEIVYSSIGVGGYQLHCDRYLNGKIKGKKKNPLSPAPSPCHYVYAIIMTMGPKQLLQVQSCA